MRLLIFAVSGCGLLPDVYTADGERACDPRSAFYEDADADGYGNPRSVYIGCSAPVGFVANADDCDDLEPDFSWQCDDGDSGA